MHHDILFAIWHIMYSTYYGVYDGDINRYPPPLGNYGDRLLLINNYISLYFNCQSLSFFFFSSIMEIVYFVPSFVHLSKLLTHMVPYFFRHGKFSNL